MNPRMERLQISQYMRAARCLLEEVIDVGGKEVDLYDELLIEKLFRQGRRRVSSEMKAELISSGLISVPEKDDIHFRIAKLVGLLEQVEEGFGKYCNQLEKVVSSFEKIAGEGSAKPYTGLALQAMVRHFCRLQDAIISQIIKSTCKRKFPHLPPRNISSSLSQLSLFENNKNSTPASHGGPNTAVSCLQQLGLMMHGHHRRSGRPIKGLPGSSVAVLWAWLFQHFLHPYPSDAEKMTLASQTGLSKNQVSNWFINARVRLWKPMIEKMYIEELADESNQSIGKEREGIADNVDD